MDATVQTDETGFSDQQTPDLPQDQDTGTRDKQKVPDWVQHNQKRLHRALGLAQNRPGPRPGQKRGRTFKKELKAAKGCPSSMAKARAKNRHLFAGNCRQEMEHRILVAFRCLLAAPDPAIAAMDPLINLDVQFAHRYYDVNLVALATPP